MLCEVCGREVPFTKSVSIEGSILRACGECSKFGKEIEFRSKGAPVAAGDKVLVRLKKPAVRDIYQELGDMELVSDYGRRIRSARNSRGMKQEDLGKLINERKSVIEQLENGRIRPDDKLVAKLEKALNIKLKEKVAETAVEQRRGQGGLTLGDIIKTTNK